jgi:protocatechuate 3,4-dioxygenase beta subunit
MALGLKRIHWLVVVSCMLGVNALGQQAGQIVGVVTDSSGGVVPGITITAKEVGTGFSQSTTTGEDGRYVFPTLRPTHYEI